MRTPQGRATPIEIEIAAIAIEIGKMHEIGKLHEIDFDHDFDHDFDFDIDTELPQFKNKNVLEAALPMVAATSSFC